jgi:alpha-galactosidase
VGRRDPQCGGSVGDGGVGRTFDLAPLIAVPPNEALIPILRALISGEEFRVASTILPNDGLLPQLSAGCAVEVSASATALGPVGDVSDDLPTPLAAVLRTEVSIQQLVADAAFTGSREAALQALLLDPGVHSSRTAEKLLADFETAHADLWPSLN